jgi:hypothetical protein
MTLKDGLLHEKILQPHFQTETANALAAIEEAKKDFPQPQPSPIAEGGYFLPSTAEYQTWFKKWFGQLR